MFEFFRYCTLPAVILTSVACLHIDVSSSNAQVTTTGTPELSRAIPNTTVANQQPVDLLAKSWDSNSKIDWEIAATLALLSKTAYEKDDELMGFVASGMGFRSCHSFNVANSAAHVLVGDNVVVVAFRGTEFTSIADWKTDAYIRFFEDPDLGNLHTGFHKAYEDVRNEVENVLRGSEGKAVWVTGHSLGGAMAVICAARIQQQGLGSPSIITFGQPRVGDKTVAKWLDRKFPNSYQRFVNDNDIVARLPYSNWLFPYSDAGRFIHLDRGNLRLRTEARSELPMTSSAPRKNVLLTIAPLPPATGSGMSALSNGGNGSAAREVYQAPDALSPLEESELDQLIREEQDIANQRSTRLYFPNADEPTLPAPRFMENGSNTPTVNAQASWWSFEKISDHYMDGYLKLIRGLRR